VHPSAWESELQLPAKVRLRKLLKANSLTQLLYPPTEIADPSQGSGNVVQVHGKTVLIASSHLKSVPPQYDDLVSTVGSKLRWSNKDTIDNPKWADFFTERENVSTAVLGKFLYIEESREKDGSIKRAGLRAPQIGAIHAVLGHWGYSSEPSTVVLPTGTGKTDCMISLATLKGMNCVLVVVPTDALRKQISEAFMSYGVLVRNGNVPLGIPYPVVGVLKTKFEDESEIKVFCNACNVIVSTVTLLGTFSDKHRKAFAEHCGELFIDEAHHVKALTWEKLKNQFSGKPIVQFTATPYRNDRKHVDGRVVFNYPVSRAQQEGYFTKLVLKERWAVVDGDEVIAREAIDSLRDDLSTGFDHIVMARANSIQRAEGLQKLYEQLGAQYKPVAVHSKLTNKENEEKVELLRTRQSRIVVCVDMFGEGFDFPELKIAALHDIHQSLSVTIQFVGRFARAKPKVGGATIIVNRGETQVDDSVSALYAEGGGADWNKVLTTLTTGASADQMARQEFFDSFSSDESPVPIRNVTPKMSTVVYKTTLNDWNPWAIKTMSLFKRCYGELNVSLKEHIAYFATLNNSPVVWESSLKLIERSFDLYLVYWDSSSNLLYINSSDNDSLHEELAKTVGGLDSQIIDGLDAFRVLDGIKRLLLRNMGVNDRLRKSVRFTMFSGADIRKFLESTQTHGSEKTHVFGDGFDGKRRITVGTSKKGRIWSWQVATNVLEWKQWCGGVGKKLIDTSIQHDAFLKDMLIDEFISGPPKELFPITIEWPDELYRRGEESVQIGNGAVQIPFFEIDLNLINPAPGDPLRFIVECDEFSSEYEVVFEKEGVSYRTANELILSFGKSRAVLSEYFAKAHPIIRYEKDCWSRGDQLFKLQDRTLQNFDLSKIIVWNWGGVDLKKESQTTGKAKDSIQGRTIHNISNSKWDRQYEIIFDDDSKGEAADIVALQIDKANCYIDLFHCKYTKAKPGKRVDDLYVVCGQAVRSGKIADNLDRFFNHLVNREKMRLKKHKVSRFERGGIKELIRLRALSRSAHIKFRVFIVQPGVTRDKTTSDQRDLVGSTLQFLALRDIEFIPITS
jgi:superfamily II DNA or RNA helicase